MVLIGHNGAGKSTLIHYLLNFYTNLSQHPFLPHFSKEVTQFHHKKIGYAPEAALLELSMSANDYFSMMQTIKQIDHFDANAALKRVFLEVDLDVAIKHYSKGMRQRLLLALAMMGEPELLILDEPTSGLDPFGQEAVESLILSLKKQYELVLCTHSLKLAYELDEEIWILQEGKIVFKGRVSSQQELETLFKQYQPQRLQ